MGIKWTEERKRRHQERMAQRRTEQGKALPLDAAKVRVADRRVLRDAILNKALRRSLEAGEFSGAREIVSMIEENGVQAR